MRVTRKYLDELLAKVRATCNLPSPEVDRASRNWTTKTLILSSTGYTRRPYTLRWTEPETSGLSNAAGGLFGRSFTASEMESYLEGFAEGCTTGSPVERFRQWRRGRR